MQDRQVTLPWALMGEDVGTFLSQASLTKLTYRIHV